jgi:hypothetical protein
MVINFQFKLAGIYYHTARYKQCLRLLEKNLKVEKDVGWRIK